MTQHRLHTLIRVPLLFSLMIMLALPAFATDGSVSPSDFAIGSLFKKYARKSNATYVNLKGSVLIGRAIYGLDSLSHVVILQLNTPTQEVVKDVEETIESDKAIADDIQEVFAQGYLISAAYRLHRSPEESAYLIYRYDMDNSNIVLTYMQGNIDSKSISSIIRQKRAVRMQSSPKKNRESKHRPSDKRRLAQRYTDKEVREAMKELHSAMDEVREAIKQAKKESIQEY
ncbi:hypothetical protein [Porphyromonas sp.]|uniref:hypothetical protein n=1 Tax=Porphyromonas sp. TaxID=1924944 RepID=UPI0026DCD5C0|nr:hypothetical protein [Porphyromonas sp.]MDO4770603.1 hypothetical protein [Porphyromonas sp.]